MVLTHLVATFFLLQVVPMTSENSFKSFESTTNMFRLWHMKMMETHCCAELCKMLALSYAICNENCKSGSCDVIKLDTFA